MLSYTSLYFTILYYSIILYATLHDTILFYNILYYILNYTIKYYSIVRMARQCSTDKVTQYRLYNPHTCRFATRYDYLNLDSLSLHFVGSFICTHTTDKLLIDCWKPRAYSNFSKFSPMCCLQICWLTIIFRRSCYKIYFEEIVCLLFVCYYFCFFFLKLQ